MNDQQAAIFQNVPAGLKTAVAGVLNGTRPLSIYSTRPSASGPGQSQILDQVQKVDPQFDQTAAKAGQTFETNADTQKFIANANTANNTVDTLVELSNQVDRSNFQLLNNGLLAFKHQTSDPTANEMLTTYNLLADELGKVLGSGQGSDFAIQLGQKLIDPTLGKEAVAGQGSLIKGRLANKLSEYKSQFKQGGLSAVTTASSGASAASGSTYKGITLPH